MAKQATPRHGNPVELPERHFTDAELALHLAAAETVITNTLSRNHTIFWLESCGYVVIPPGESANKIEPVEPKFTPPICECGAPTRVTSTRGRVRYLKCTNEECGRTLKVSQTSVT